jgi:hypothetical protein
MEVGGGCGTFVLLVSRSDLILLDVFIAFFLLLAS